MIEYRNLRVAILGAGSVGAQVAALLLEHGDELAGRVGRRPRAGRASPCATSTPRARRHPARAAHDRRRVAHPRRRHRRRADRRHRAGPRVHRCSRSTPAPMSSPPTRRCSPPTAPSCSRRPSRSARSSTTRRPSAARSRSSARCATASRATACSASSASSTARPTTSSTAWTREGDTLEEALAVATELGYAEADPTADIEGYDAAQKAAILASLAFHTIVPARGRAPRGHHRGHPRAGRRRAQGRLRRQAARDLRAARRPGDRRRTASARACIPRSCRVSHPLAAVHGANNAVFVQAEAAGNLMFYGAGAGGMQTASAVLGDLVSAARRHVVGGPGVAESTHANLPVLPMARACDPLPDHPPRARRARRARAGSRRCSAITGSRSRRSQQSRRRRRRRSVRRGSPHRYPCDRHAPGDRGGARRDGRRPRGRAPSSNASISVLTSRRTVGTRWPTSGAECCANTPTVSTSRMRRPIITLGEGGTPLIPARRALRAHRARRCGSSSRA